MSPLNILVVSRAYGHGSTPSGVCTGRLVENIGAAGALVTVVYSSGFKAPPKVKNVTLRPCSPFPERPMRMFIALGNRLGKELCHLFWTLRASRSVLGPPLM